MRSVQRLSPLTLLASVAIGLAAGLLLQFARSTAGLAPFRPPISLGGTLIILGLVLLMLGLMLRRAISQRSRGAVDPFHAVRLLAGARAGSLGGALFAGFGGGLALQLLTRSVPALPEMWTPMLFVAGSGVLLAVCSLFTEWCCRVPPSENDANADAENDRDTDGGDAIDAAQG